MRPSAATEGAAWRAPSACRVPPSARATCLPGTPIPRAAAACALLRPRAADTGPLRPGLASRRRYASGAGRYRSYPGSAEAARRRPVRRAGLQRIDSSVTRRRGSACDICHPGTPISRPDAIRGPIGPGATDMTLNAPWIPRARRYASEVDNYASCPGSAEASKMRPTSSFAADRTLAGSHGGSSPPR